MKSARQADPVASAHSGPPHPQSGQGSNLQRPKVPPSSMPRRQRPSVKGCLEPAALPPPRLDCSERSGIRLNFASSQSGAFCERAARGHSTRVAATRPRPPLPSPQPSITSTTSRGICGAQNLLTEASGPLRPSAGTRSLQLHPTAPRDPFVSSSRLCKFALLPPRTTPPTTTCTCAVAARRTPPPSPRSHPHRLQYTNPTPLPFDNHIIFFSYHIQGLTESN